MTIQHLFFLIAISLFSYVSCRSNIKSEVARIVWKFPDSGDKPEMKIGKQMPPHHEPDAILINAGRNGPPKIPEGNFPQFPEGPGVFGFPRSGFFPGAFGMPRLPAYPNPFGVPRGQTFPGNLGVHGIPNNPHLFITPGQGNPMIPNESNAYGVQGNPSFTVRTSYLVPNDQPSHMGDPHAFGHPTVFTVAGDGHEPFPTVPNFYLPNRGSKIPETPDNFSPPRGMMPESPARRRNDFQPRGMPPDFFYPESSLIPSQPGFNSNGNFPRQELEVEKYMVI